MSNHFASSFLKLSCVALAGAVAVTADASDNYWIGGSSGSIDEPANWSEGMAPVYDNRNNNILVFTNSVSSTPKEHLYATHIRVADDCEVSIGGGGSNRFFLNGDQVEGVFREAVAEVGSNATLTLKPQFLGMYGWSGARTTLIKRGSGLMTFYDCVEDFTDIRVEEGCLWFRGTSDTVCTIGASCKYLITICDGARVEWLSTSSFDNRMAFQVDEGGVLNARGRSDTIGAICGAGLVSNGVFRLTLYNGPHMFSGTVSNATVDLNKAISGKSATTDDQFGFVIGSARAFADERATLSINASSAISAPSSPEKCCVRFAPDIGTFYVGEFAGSAVHPIWLADTDGNAVTMRVHVASAPYVCGPTNPNQRGCLLYDRNQTFDARLGAGADLGAVGGATVTLGPNAEINPDAVLRFNEGTTLNLGGRTVTVRRFVGGGKWTNGKLIRTDAPGLTVVIR